MNVNRNIIGHKLNPSKKERARELRREMTPEEKILWHYLRDNQIGFKFRRQQVIDGFIVDFYCHALGIFIEIDGGIHLRQKDYDAERDRIIKTRGLNGIRITNDQIRDDLYKTIALIRQTCLKLSELQK